MSSWIWKLTRGLRRTATLVEDLATLLSFNPRRIARRWANRAIHRGIRRATRRLYFRGRRR